MDYTITISGVSETFPSIQIESWHISFLCSFWDFLSNDNGTIQWKPSFIVVHCLYFFNMKKTNHNVCYRRAANKEGKKNSLRKITLCRKNIFSYQIFMFMLLFEFPFYESIRYNWTGTLCVNFLTDLLYFNITNTLSILSFLLSVSLLYSFSDWKNMQTWRKLFASHIQILNHILMIKLFTDDRYYWNCKIKYISFILKKREKKETIQTNTIHNIY